jgi:hypothetical protein
MRAAALFVGLVVTSAFGMSAHADPYPLKTPRAYDRGSETMDGWGALRLSETAASFSNLKGAMRLIYVGTLPDDLISKDNPGRVYRVLNAVEFLSATKTTQDLGVTNPSNILA